MNLNEALEKFHALEDKISAYSHASALLYYDGATTAPSATADNRAHTLGILGQEYYMITTSEQTVALLEFLDEHKNELPKADQRAVYLALKDIKEMKKIPMDEYIGYEKLLVKAGDVWHKAKETNDFDSFCPYLQEIFDTNLRFAGYLAPDKNPYDFWLGKYEDGLTMKKCDEFFSLLREKIVPLIKKISEKEQIDDSCLYGEFDDEAQKKLSYKLMEIMGIDLSHCGLGTTEHPFTTSLGSHHDVRITTNFDKNYFASSMYSVIHEGGHALYDMNPKDEYAYTLLDGGVSMGIHESQSRFYENLIGRSKEYIELVFPILLECYPEQLKGKTADDIYRAVNRVTPSLIRTEADEVTYCLHVMIRYELEKRIMAGELLAKDLPREWNRMYKEYLGVDVPSDTEGVLQDSHWSGGSIGYFPSYALGSAYGAHLLKKMKESVDVSACLKEGNFNPINSWNKENIWQHGSLYTPSELLLRVLGEEFNPIHFVNYLEEKYTKLYSL